MGEMLNSRLKSANANAQVDAHVLCSPTLADLDNDGNMELVRDTTAEIHRLPLNTLIK